MTEIIIFYMALFIFSYGWTTLAAFVEKLFIGVFIPIFSIKIYKDEFYWVRNKE